MQHSLQQRSHVTKGVGAEVPVKQHSLVEIQPVFLLHHTGCKLEFSLTDSIVAEPALDFKFEVAYRLRHGQTVSRLLLLLLFFPNNFVVYCNKTKLLYNNYRRSDYKMLQLTIYTIRQYLRYNNY